MNGWNNVSQIIDKPITYDDLPEAMKVYLCRIEKWTSAKIALISFGPDRKETILIPDVLPNITIHA